MTTLLCQLPSRYHTDAVGVANGGQAVRDDQDSAASHQPPECLLHNSLKQRAQHSAASEPLCVDTQVAGESSTRKQRSRLERHRAFY